MCTHEHTACVYPPTHSPSRHAPPQGPHVPFIPFFRWSLRPCCGHSLMPPALQLRNTCSNPFIGSIKASFFQQTLPECWFCARPCGGIEMNSMWSCPCLAPRPIWDTAWLTNRGQTRCWGIVSWVFFFLVLTKNRVLP